MIRDLYSQIFAALSAIVQITVAFALGLALGAVLVLRAIWPALLRGACVTLFVAGLTFGCLAVARFYSGLTDLIGGILTAAALAWLLVSILLVMSSRLWSALALAGACGAGIAVLLPFLADDSIVVLVARGLPVSLAAAGTLYLALKFKKEKHNEGQF